MPMARCSRGWRERTRCESDNPPARAPKAADVPPATAPQEQNGEVAVVIDRLSKHFGSAPALQDLSAQISYGRLTGLVGPDGAGKTTLMRILTGLLVPNSGHARVAGFDVVDDNDAIHVATGRSEEHTSELQSLMRISYAVFCL